MPSQQKGLHGELDKHYNMLTAENIKPDALQPVEGNLTCPG